MKCRSYKKIEFKITKKFNSETKILSVAKYFMSIRVCIALISIKHDFYFLKKFKIPKIFLKN